MKSKYKIRFLKIVLAAILAGTIEAVLMPVFLIAGSISFSVPVDCQVGQTCFIQNYYDHDSGPGRKDYACGRLSYDGHTGTDFRVKNLPAMQHGVSVLAAAPGVVTGVRDEMPDISIKQIDPERIKGREAGNGVLIDHGNGWISQYSHLLHNSVVVKPGQRVNTGEKLGLIGLSGNTEFPHVEFAVRYRGKPVDPFVGINGWSGCEDTRGTLWATNALEKMHYIPTGVLTAGFSQMMPEAEKARQGDYPSLSYSTNAKMMVFWVDLFGVQKGDRQKFKLVRPDDTQIVAKSEFLDKSNVSWFAFAGCRKPANGWPTGKYKGVYTLTRKDKTIITIQLDFEMTPATETGTSSLNYPTRRIPGCVSFHASVFAGSVAFTFTG
ncbi:MAG: M23 family metallopeptidase [Pseudomonadota bacterium]